MIKMASIARKLSGDEKYMYTLVSGMQKYSKTETTPQQQEALDNMKAKRGNK